ncbi:hypothetical protein NP493_1287g01006 [Ridgeia piscesae]|uniref:Uncharacterized protein n=1 Tax=Ridgeia piscesae TaxID=27915 RepID=A0AAD9K8R8_RIDPI|nr:hypothetical protein NP493_1287g01006 [Ridgeia piscesae]
MIDTTCIKVLYPINGVWFCLGFCIFILLPSIILSFKLVTLYRKLDSYDESPYEYADPIYDAYRPSDYHDFGDQPREMLIQKLDTTRPRSYEPLGPVDNPVYMMDSEVELAGPPDSNRPRFFSPGYPVYAKPAENRAVDPGRPSPPPSYASSTGVAEASYDTRL